MSRFARWGGHDAYEEVEETIEVADGGAEAVLRLAKDFEATIASATAFLYAASVLLLTRKLARSM